MPTEPLRIMHSKANSLQWSIDELVNQNENGTIDFDFALQRGSVWDSLRNGLLIHSIMIGFPIGEFYLNKLPDGIYEGLEGKQRKTAICNYKNGLYKLHAKTPPVMLSDGTEYPVARHTFEMLPKELQRRILMYPLRIWWFDNASLEEKVMFIQRINNGKPVSATDLARYKVKSRNLFIKMTKHQAISFIVREQDKAKLSDEDIVQDIWIMANIDNPSLLAKDRLPVLEHNEVSNEQQEEFVRAFDYMLSFYRAIEGDKKLLNKVRSKTHITSLGYMGVLAVRNKLAEEDFVGTASDFFRTIGTKSTSGDVDVSVSISGGSKPEQVQYRMGELKKVLLA